MVALLLTWMYARLVAVSGFVLSTTTLLPLARACGSGRVFCQLHTMRLLTYMIGGLQTLLLCLQRVPVHPYQRVIVSNMTDTRLYTRRASAEPACNWCIVQTMQQGHVPAWHMSFSHNQGSPPGVQAPFCRHCYCQDEHE